MNRIIHEKQDMTHLSWSKIRNSSGTAGSFLKAYSVLGGKINLLSSIFISNGKDLHTHTTFSRSSPRFYPAMPEK